MIDIPVNVVLQPMKVEVPFRSKLKLQVAFYRGSKISKTQPRQFTDSKAEVVVKQTLTLSTTLQYSPSTKNYQPKEVNLQLAYEADGMRTILQHQLNLVGYLEQSDTCTLVMGQSPLVTIAFTLKITFTDWQPQRVNDQKRANRLSQQPKEVTSSLESLYQYQKYPWTEKNKILTDNSSVRGGLELGQKQRMDNMQTPKKVVKNCPEDISISSKTGRNQLALAREQDLLEQLSSKSEQLEMYRNKVSFLEGKNQELVQLFDELKDNHCKIVLEVKRKEAAMQEVRQAKNVVQTKLRTDQGILTNCKEQFKKLYYRNKELEKDVLRLSEEIEEQKKAMSSWQKSSSTVSSQNSHTNTSSSAAESQLRQLKEHLMYLEGLNEDIQKENESMQTELEEKDRTIRDLKSVVHRLQREQLQSKINAQYLHDKIEKGQVEYQYTVQQLQNKLRKLSCKKCKENNLPQDEARAEEWKAKLSSKQTRIRQLEAKLTGENGSQHQQLHKEINRLKQIIRQKQQPETGFDNTALLQLKIECDNLRKELERAQRNQRAVLIEKSQFESRTKTLQQDVVQCKSAIARILNAVQELGTQQLFSQVMNHIS